eukprot:7347943-Prymnesium_polylepis.1
MTISQKIPPEQVLFVRCDSVVKEVAMEAARVVASDGGANGGAEASNGGACGDGGREAMVVRWRRRRRTRRSWQLRQRRRWC